MSDWGFWGSYRSFVGITLHQLAPVPRNWVRVQMLVGGAAVLFIFTIEGLVVLAVGVAVVVWLWQVMIYRRFGFVRLMGVPHILWVGLLFWLYGRADLIAERALMPYWLVPMAFVFVVSILIDCIDIARYIRGEREPYYRSRSEIS